MQLHPFLSKIDLNLDTSSLGLATLLVFTGFALFIIEKIPKSAILEKFKLSAAGVEAQFERLEQVADDIKEVETPVDIKEEIEDIRETSREPKAVFLELVIEIEKKLKILTEKKAITSWKYTSVRKMVSILKEYQIIDEKLGYLINEFWKIRNKVIHGELEITKYSLDEAIDIGETILAKLDKAHKE